MPQLSNVLRLSYGSIMQIVGHIADNDSGDGILVAVIANSLSIVASNPSVGNPGFALLLRVNLTAFPLSHRVQMQTGMRFIQA